MSQTPQKRAAHPKNEIGMNLCNKFPLPLLYLGHFLGALRESRQLKAVRGTVAMKGEGIFDNEKGRPFPFQGFLSPSGAIGSPYGWIRSPCRPL